VLKGAKAEGEWVSAGNCLMLTLYSAIRIMPPMFIIERLFKIARLNDIKMACAKAGHLLCFTRRTVANRPES